MSKRDKHLKNKNALRAEAIFHYGQMLHHLGGLLHPPQILDNLKLMLADSQ